MRDLQEYRVAVMNAADVVAAGGDPRKALPRHMQERLAELFGRSGVPGPGRGFGPGNCCGCQKHPTPPEPPRPKPHGPRKGGDPNVSVGSNGSNGELQALRAEMERLRGQLEARSPDGGEQRHRKPGETNVYQRTAGDEGKGGWARSNDVAIPTSGAITAGTAFTSEFPADEMARLTDNLLCEWHAIASGDITTVAESFSVELSLNGSDIEQTERTPLDIQLPDADGEHQPDEFAGEGYYLPPDSIVGVTIRALTDVDAQNQDSTVAVRVTGGDTCTTSR